MADSVSNEPPSISVAWPQGKRTVPFQDGVLDLTLLPRGVTFTVYRDEHELFQSSVAHLEQLDKTVRIAESVTCLEHVDLNPVTSTSIFYKNDRQVVVLSKLIGIEHDCPITISLCHEGSLAYCAICVVPGTGRTDGTRLHAHGIFLTPEVPKGRYSIAIRLITGRVLFECDNIHILDRDRGAYGRQPDLRVIMRGRLG